MSDQKRCVVIRPPAKGPCGADADRRVTFFDGSVATACLDCALYLQQVAAQGYHTTIAVEKIQ